jgi:hypothetical protein
MVVATPAFACLNSPSLEIKMLMRQDKRDYALRQVARIEKDFATNKSAANTNDLAVARILFGRYDEAVVLLKELEARHPGRAATAANLGTVYELQGKDQTALQWIREGIRRDENEHEGSEWVHVRILEAKIALKSDLLWLESHTVLGRDFGDAARPLAPALPVDHLGKTHSWRHASRAVRYQLYERTFFVKPPDRVVADLYAAAGDMAFLLCLETDAEQCKRWIKEARWGYQGALTYESPRRALLQGRLADLQRLESEAARVTKP